MAPTVTAFSKKAEAAAAAFASVSAADIIRAPVVQRAIPLDLAPLLRPYKRLGRLSLRVERVPQRAKLSAGRNNGDGSWSLASDELEGLTYLVPSNLVIGQELAVRIMSFEDAVASTIKVVPFPIAPSQEDDEPDIRSAAHDPAAPSQLGKMQSLFAVRESELAELRASLEKATAAKAAELAEARAAWERELNARLSEAAEQARTARELERRSWEAEQESRAAQIEARAEQKAAKERDRWQGQSERRAETERQRWQAQAEQHIEAEYRRWQVQADRGREADLHQWKIESAETLAQAEARWRAEETARAMAARADWERQSAGMQAEAAQKSSRLEAALADAIAQTQGGSDQLRNELAMVKAALAQREQELAAQPAAAAQDRERWKADEAARFAAAQAEWQQQSARLLADASARCTGLEARLSQALAQSAPVSDDGTPEIARLRDELAGTRSALAERESHLARHQSAFEQERERWRQAAEESLQSAAASWKAEERLRLDAALAKARSQSEEALAIATARYEISERALAEAQAAVTGNRRDDPYVEGLRKELSTLRKTLVNREVELGHVRAALDQARPLHIHRATHLPALGQFRNTAPSEEEETDKGARKTLVRDFMVVVCLVVPAILFYPNFAPYLPDSIRSGIATLSGGLLSAGDAPAPAAPVLAPAAPAAQHQTAMVIRAVNMRATPAVKGAIVLTLQRGTLAAILEQRGNWTLVEMPAKSGAGKPQQGWVYSTYLKSRDSSN